MGHEGEQVHALIKVGLIICSTRWSAHGVKIRAIQQSAKWLALKQVIGTENSKTVLGGVDCDEVVAQLWGGHTAAFDGQGHWYVLKNVEQARLRGSWHVHHKFDAVLSKCERQGKGRYQSCSGQKGFLKQPF